MPQQRPSFSGFGLMGQPGTSPRDAAPRGLTRQIDVSGGINPFAGTVLEGFAAGQPAQQPAPQGNLSGMFAPQPAPQPQNPLADMQAAQPMAQAPLSFQRPLAEPKQAPDRSNVVQAILSQMPKRQGGGSFGGLF